MNRYNKRVRWNFHIAVFGYGRNCREALFDAANRLKDDLICGSLDVGAIEDHETVSVDESDYLERRSPPESKL